MNYMGGKWRQGPTIAAEVARRHRPGVPYYEPFCGALGAACRAVPLVHAAGGASHLSDISESVINMWRAVLAGWDPPARVTEAEYDRAKARRDPRDPLTAFCGFGISFGGKWFGGYARNYVTGRRYQGTNKDGKSRARYKTDYAGNARRSILLKAGMLRGCDLTLEHCDYREVRPRGAVVYLDPPYEGRVRAHDFRVFNHREFWQYALDLVRVGNVVLVTGFGAPRDWISVHSWGDTVVRHHASRGTDETNEQIFVHRDQVVSDLL